MKTQIAKIVTETLAEFAADFARNISECVVKYGCVTDMEGPEVFEELARQNDEPLRSTGNAHNWDLDGHEAALTIAKSRAWTAMLKEDDAVEWSDACEAVNELVSVPGSIWPAKGLQQ